MTLRRKRKNSDSREGSGGMMLPWIHVTLLAGWRLSEHRRCRSGMLQPVWYERNAPWFGNQGRIKSPKLRRDDDAVGARKSPETEWAASGHPVSAAARGRQQVLRGLRGERFEMGWNDAGRGRLLEARCAVILTGNVCSDAGLLRPLSLAGSFCVVLNKLIYLCCAMQTGLSLGRSESKRINDIERHLSKLAEKTGSFRSALFKIKSY